MLCNDYDLLYCCDSIPLFCLCMHVCIMICLLLCVLKVSCLSRAWLSCSATKLLALILCVRMCVPFWFEISLDCA